MDATVIFFAYRRERQHMVAFSQQVLKIDTSRLWAPTRLSESAYDLQLSPGSKQRIWA